MNQPWQMSSMDPDVVEIPPPPIASGSRTRKPRQAVIAEVIDVEQYEFRNNVADKKNKGKAIRHISSSYDHNPFSHLASSEAVPTELDDYAMFQAILNSQDIPTDVEVVMPTQPRSPYTIMAPYLPSGPFKVDDCASSSSRPIAAEVIPSAQANYLRDFKRFDTVDDFSDHHFASQGKASKQHAKGWVKKVQSDWKILENDLPETIFVRACESRMDLLRAVIIGAEGTPYHDGLLFFDIQFSDTYPSAPPKVHYHSGGLRINPNLYNCGRVCLSLLGTWTGDTRESWIPEESTMLQLLVSIQALILNQKPYFNEPGYEQSMGTQSGELLSEAYSENVFMLSLKTMVYSMRKPPKHFEEFVRSHYFMRAHHIVKACNAYTNGAPLGSMVKGGFQDVSETSRKGSDKFRAEVACFMKTVVDEFVKLGVKELQEKQKP
ncbi:putative ubiquitin-conjugating enzyme E2 38 [Raphanus sativus]|uniref:E2 ubiquitin-conjugating enzyme n=1 Tax=Raphanus sativus TaxID=3726 RepID=A0A6J0JW45_RAPSA|nr:putative ubiquitin-conjugating enzyme E2 38 [Raphanus sativus]